MNWKSPPADHSKLWLNRSLELQIILNCDWDCHACNALSNFHSIAFNRRGTMTLEQIRHFIREMQELNAYFGRIRILGGEPTIHKHFAEIVELLHEGLVTKGHIGFLEVITNGDHPDRITPVKHLFSRVRVSGERDKQKHHVANMRYTPATLGYKGIPCSQPSYCGWSLSYYGYAPCSAGAGLMRLRDLMGTHQRLSLPIVKGTTQNWPQLQELCDHCLHGLRDEDKIKCGTGTQAGQYALNAPHPEVWDKLAPWLQGKQPTWQVYGQTEPAAAQ